MAVLQKFKDRFLSGLAVDKAITNHGPRMAKILGQRYAALFENAEELFWQHLLMIRTILRHTRENLIEAVRRHAEELADDAAFRAARDEAMAEARSAVFTVRGTCDSNFDLDLLAIDFPRRLSSNPAVLQEQIDHLLVQFASPGLKLPEPKAKKIVIEPDSLVETLKDPAKNLRTARADVDREAKEAEVTQVEQDRAMKEWDVVFQWGAQSTQGLFLMAGEEKLASRVQPSRTRPGRTEQPPQEDGESPAGETEPPPVPPAPPSVA